MNYVALCTRWYTLYHMVHSCKRKIARHPWSAASLARPQASPRKTACKRLQSIESPARLNGISLSIPSPMD